VQHIAVCCSEHFVLQFLVPVCVLQCVAVCCSVLQCVAVCCSVLQCVAVSTSSYNFLSIERATNYKALWKMKEPLIIRQRKASFGFCLTRLNHKRDTNYKALWKMSCKDKAYYGSAPLCSVLRRFAVYMLQCIRASVYCTLEF